MTALFRRTLALIPSLLLMADAMAFEAGWTQTTIAGATPEAPGTTVALYYPTQAAARAIVMGPFTPKIAIQAQPVASVKGLIVISHGTGGTELGHTSLAEAFAQSGYLVAAVRHPGDNWQDHSLLKETPERFFDERPQQLRHVISALLRDPRWKDRIAGDAQGPRVGAVGHSAGGYSVLALAGGQPDLSRIARHCGAERAQDPIFCSMGRPAGANPPAAAPTAPNPAKVWLADPRVRAVVALAPVGAVFTAASLASIRIPAAVYVAELDQFLVPQFHAEWVAQNLPRAELHRVPNAWHFAFMDTPSRPIATDDGDVAADPAGFDRAAYLKQLSIELVAFFDKALS